MKEDDPIELLPLVKRTAVVIAEPDEKHKENTDVVVAVAETEFTISLLWPGGRKNNSCQRQDNKTLNFSTRRSST